MTFVINGRTVSNSIALWTMNDTKSLVTLDPPSASPVLKTKVNITLEDAFPYTLEKEHFSVNATNISNPEYYRQMNVINVYNDEKKLEVMFGGADRKSVV